MSLFQARAATIRATCSLPDFFQDAAKLVIVVYAIIASTARRERSANSIAGPSASTTHINGGTRRDGGFPQSEPVGCGTSFPPRPMNPSRASRSPPWGEHEGGELKSELVITFYLSKIGIKPVTNGQERFPLPPTEGEKWATKLHAARPSCRLSGPLWAQCSIA